MFFHERIDCSNNRIGIAHPYNHESQCHSNRDPWSVARRVATTRGILFKSLRILRDRCRSRRSRVSIDLKYHVRWSGASRNRGQSFHCYDFGIDNSAPHAQHGVRNPFRAHLAEVHRKRNDRRTIVARYAYTFILQLIRVSCPNISPFRPHFQRLSK